MYQTQTVAQHEMIIINKTDVHCVSADESTVTSMSTASSDDSSLESLYELDISRLLTFQRMEYSADSIDNARMLFDCDCSDITEQDYSTDESFCDVDDEELDLIQKRVTRGEKPLNLEDAQRNSRWRRLQVVGVCVGIPSLLLLLEPCVGRSTRS